MKYSLVTDNQLLKQVCEQAKSKKVVALDTEFVRTKTLYPQIGLVQMYDGETISLIDPLKCNQFEPLIDLLTDPEVVKVLHSCSEDLETFKRAFNCLPVNLFDTQIGAAYLGMGETLGYAALVNKQLDIELDKSESRTDWLQRPLSDTQLDYAAADVFYLLSVYHQLEPLLQQNSRYSWVIDEVNLLCTKKSQKTPYEAIFLDIKNSWQLSPRDLAILRELAAWRQQTAEQGDIALNFVVKESNLFQLAKAKPQSVPAIAAIDGLTPKEVRKYGKQLLSCINRGLAVPEQQCPDRIPFIGRNSSFKKAMATLKQMVVEVAEENQVSAQCLASKRQLSNYLKWLWKIAHPDEVIIEPDVVRGWRGEILSQPLAKVALPKWQQ